jgi:lipoprotein-anchoring transpeptidase ErfK/SrfK
VPPITSSAQLDPTAAVRPATAGKPLPERGKQIQITKPPPPPPTLPAWDPYRLPANSGSGRRVVYSKSQQTVWALDANNTVIKVHRVSGKQTPFDPAPGVYSVWSRSRYTYSINNPSITWGYMIRFAKGARGGNIGLHEIPSQYGRPVQSIAQLGQPLSGGCVRQSVPDAVWMWNWAGIGTVVVVTP